jgi:hypothetical protein
MFIFIACHNAVKKITRINPRFRKQTKRQKPLNANEMLGGNA